MYLSRYWKTLAIMMASGINFTCAHLLLFIWKEPYYYYAILFIGSFLIGALVKKYESSFIYTILSFLISAVTSIGILVGPAIIYGATRSEIDIGIMSFGSSFAKMSIVSLPLCFFIGLFGCFVGQVAETRSRAV